MVNEQTCHVLVPGEGGGYYRCQIPKTSITVPISFFGYCPTCRMKLEVSGDGQSGTETAMCEVVTFANDNTGPVPEHAPTVAQFVNVMSMSQNDRANRSYLMEAGMIYGDGRYTPRGVGIMEALQRPVVASAEAQATRLWLNLATVTLSELVVQWREKARINRDLMANYEGQEKWGAAIAARQTAFVKDVCADQLAAALAADAEGRADNPPTLSAEDTRDRGLPTLGELRGTLSAEGDLREKGQPAFALPRSPAPSAEAWLAAALADNCTGPEGQRMTPAEWMEWAWLNAESEADAIGADTLAELQTVPAYHKTKVAKAIKEGWLEEGLLQTVPAGKFFGPMKSTPGSEPGNNGERGSDE